MTIRIDLLPGRYHFTPLFISPDSKRLFAVSEAHPLTVRERRLEVYALEADAVPEIIEDPSGWIQHAALRVCPSAGGSAEAVEAQVLVLNDDGRVKLMDINTYRSIDNDFLRVGGWAQRIACSKDGKRAAVGHGRHPQVAVYDMDSRSQVQELGGVQSWADCGDLFFSPDGEYIIAQDTHQAGIWNHKGGLTEVWGDQYDHLAITPDSRKLVWLHSHGGSSSPGYYKVHLYDMEDSLAAGPRGHIRIEEGATSDIRPLRTWKFGEDDYASLNSVEVSSDGRRLIVGGSCAGRGYDRDEICEWSLDAPSGLIRNDPSFRTIMKLGRAHWVRVTPDNAKLATCWEDMVPTGLGDEEAVGNRFLVVCPYPGFYHHVLG